jgi:hypothetical protein
MVEERNDNENPLDGLKSLFDPYQLSLEIQGRICFNAGDSKKEVQIALLPDQQQT